MGQCVSRSASSVRAVYEPVSVQCVRAVGEQVSVQCVCRSVSSV